MSDQSTTLDKKLTSLFNRAVLTGFGQLRGDITEEQCRILMATLDKECREAIESECQRREKLAVERIEAVQLGRIKRRFNGFGGTLGFTQGELLALLSPSPKRE